MAQSRHQQPIKDLNQQCQQGLSSFLPRHTTPTHVLSTFTAVPIITVLGLMLFGPAVPLVIAGLALSGYEAYALTLAACIITSMGFARHSPGWCRFFLGSSNFFKKGVFLHIERRAADAMIKSPSLWCMHPHGTGFGFGFCLNGAIRFRAEADDKYCPECLTPMGQDRRRRADGVQAPVLFRIPLLRNALIGFGCCTPATRAGMFSLFTKRIDFGILPGGMCGAPRQTGPYQSHTARTRMRAGASLGSFA